MNYIKVDSVVCNILLNLVGQMLVKLLRGPLTVEQEGSTWFNITYNVKTFYYVRWVVTCDKVRLGYLVG